MNSIIILFLFQKWTEFLSNSVLILYSAMCAYIFENHNIFKYLFKIKNTGIKGLFKLKNTDIKTENYLKT